LSFCKDEGIKVVGKIPFNPKVKAMVEGKTIIEYSAKSDVADEIRHVWGENLCSARI
jgi:MinD superfamily P-loop ATPase